MGFRPVDAAVGDAFSIDQGLARDELLGSCDEIALNHDTDDIAVAGGDLAGDVLAD